MDYKGEPGPVMCPGALRDTYAIFEQSFFQKSSCMFQFPGVGPCTCRKMVCMLFELTNLLNTIIIKIMWGTGAAPPLCGPMMPSAARVSQLTG